MTSELKTFSNVLAPVSIGELIDKITILEIKSEHMNKTKLKNVNKELGLLKNILQDNNIEIGGDLVNNLKKVNNKLWEIEDKIRIKESKQEFDKEFVEIARSVYKQNDIRASIKKKINFQYNSELVEEKSYRNYSV